MGWGQRDAARTIALAHFRTYLSAAIDSRDLVKGIAEHGESWRWQSWENREYQASYSHRRAETLNKGSSFDTIAELDSLEKLRDPANLASCEAGNAETAFLNATEMCEGEIDGAKVASGKKTWRESQTSYSRRRAETLNKESALKSVCQCPRSVNFPSAVAWSEACSPWRSTDDERQLCFLIDRNSRMSRWQD